MTSLVFFASCFQGTLKGRILLHAELPGELENATAGHLGWSVARPKTKRKKIR